MEQDQLSHNSHANDESNSLNSTGHSTLAPRKYYENEGIIP